MNNKQLGVDVSALFVHYLNKNQQELKEKFNNFTLKYYYEALKELNKAEIKEEIIYYTKIICYYDVFKNLMSSQDDFEDILKVFAIKKDYYPMLEIIDKEKYISHCNLAKKLGKSSQALTDYIKKLPDFELFTRQGLKRTLYNLTDKGSRIVQHKKKLIFLENVNENYKQLSKDISKMENEIEELSFKIQKNSRDIEDLTYFVHSISNKKIEQINLFENKYNFNRKEEILNEFIQ